MDRREFLQSLAAFFAATAVRPLDAWVRPPRPDGVALLRSGEFVYVEVRVSSHDTELRLNGIDYTDDLSVRRAVSNVVHIDSEAVWFGPRQCSAIRMCLPEHVKDVTCGFAYRQHPGGWAVDDVFVFDDRASL